jgi:hypothetical protein
MVSAAIADVSPARSEAGGSLATNATMLARRAGPARRRHGRGDDPGTTAITEAPPAAAQGVGSAVNDLARELGGAVGIAVIGSALTATYRSHLSLPGLPAAAVRQARDSFRRRRTPRRPGRGSRRAHRRPADRPAGRRKLRPAGGYRRRAPAPAGNGVA